MSRRREGATMSLPTGVYFHSSLFLARKVSLGEFLLIPTREVLQLFEFIAIHYARRHEVNLWLLVLMSNHYHASADDPGANYPAFLRDFHAKFAVALVELLDRKGTLWMNRPPARSRVPEPHLQWRTALYAATNPSRAGICPDSSHWPGVIFTPEDCGKTRTVKRPKIVEELWTSFPESITYTVPVPACCANEPPESIRKRFGSARMLMDQTITKERGGEPFIGVRAALALPRTTTPGEIPDNGAAPRFIATPEVKEALWHERVEFLSAYRKAHGALREGDLVDWPVGTWARRVYDKVPP
jgi:hypothetical protein